jgi:hypothetical protein
VVPAAIYFFYVAHYSVNVLFDDDWNVVPIVDAALHGHLTFQLLWAQHSDNRMLVPNLVFVFFGAVDHLDTRSIILFGAVLYIASYFLFAHLYRLYAGRHLGVVAGLLFGLVWFSFQDYENALWAFQLAWIMIAFLLLLMLVALSGRELGNWNIAGAALCAGVAGFSSLQGLLLWPIGLLCLIWRWRSIGRPKLAVGLWMAAFGVASGLYFWGYQGATGGVIGYALRHFGNFSKFVLLELGNVLPGTNDGFRLICGAIIGLAAIWVCFRCITVGRNTETIPLPLALIAYGLSFDVLAAMGRLGFGIPFAHLPWPAAAAVSRYSMANLFVVIGIATYLLPLMLQVRTRRGSGEWLLWASMVGITALMAALVCQVVVADRYGIQAAREWHQEKTVAAEVEVNLIRASASRQDEAVQRYAWVGVSTATLEPVLAKAKADGLAQFARVDKHD